ARPQPFALASGVVADEIVEVTGGLPARDGFGHRGPGQLGVLLEGLDRGGGHRICTVIGTTASVAPPASTRPWELPGRAPVGIGYRSRTEDGPAAETAISAGMNAAVPPG